MRMVDTIVHILQLCQCNSNANGFKEGIFLVYAYDKKNASVYWIYNNNCLATTKIVISEKEHV